MNICFSFKKKFFDVLERDIFIKKKNFFLMGLGNGYWKYESQWYVRFKKEDVFMLSGEGNRVILWEDGWILVWIFGHGCGCIISLPC